MKNSPNHKIVIVDDHLLFASSLGKLIASFEDFSLLFTASNGLDLQEKMTKAEAIPDVILLDVNMPVLNGYETLVWLKEVYPNIKVLMLSMDDDEDLIIKMIKTGAKGYLLKNINPEDLQHALIQTIDKGFYYSEQINEILLDVLNGKETSHTVELKENEITFIKLACTEKTYKEIADIMSLSPKTIDGYREKLFERLQIKSRVGLVMYAIKNNLIEI
ncbi:response regulator transcription factor [Planktosalinus lacus]|uniref:DNA-binding response regulator n=1 Tax=Planktosalinus lacus TaxID=1526573 RepID=A0A8J2YBM6_9FLAO|nr:response regulator transcription factor [Planktosalinus lacus]GGD97202.1 DNA-binding response regulator [Planktosalinus lacus]